MPKLVLSALLNLRQPINDVGGKKLFEEIGERKRFVVFSIDPPQGFDASNGKLGEQLKSLAAKYADALGTKPELTRIHVL